jgi:phthalate 4,5-dioxygenase reductase subunit
VQAGDVLPTSPPANYFALDPQARSHLLIAGGIGITPVMSMVRELQARGADFRVVYLARTPESAAFRDELLAPDLRDRVLVHHNDGDAARQLNIAALLAMPRDGEHVYCCGPRRLMQSVRELASHWPAGHVHFEDFGTSEQPEASEDQPFKVRLARSGKTLDVPCGTSILEVIRSAGVPAPSSCESGTCGACRTPLLAGCADHRDYVLDEDEHGTEIMICVSRARGSLLEIDL